MKKILISLIALMLALSLCTGCAPVTDGPGSSSPSADSTPVDQSSSATDESSPDESTPESPETPSTPPADQSSTGDEGGKTEPDEPEQTLNGVPLSEYTIVYGSGCLDYTVRAAEYIRDAVAEKTGVTLTMAADDVGKGSFDHEIVVGETNRPISAMLDVDTEGVQFAMVADGGHVAMEGDFFVIAAAAYYFVETYVNGEDDSIPEEITVCDPIVKEAKNYIFLIGDGMGIYQTLLFDIMSATDATDYSDGEDFFYGYLLPYYGLARTNSLSGVTDSAAAGTALATGYKTINGYVGKDRNLKDVTSLTEIAGTLGMATAVMSTEARTGATPSSFSAHANNRNDSSAIIATQAALQAAHDTIIRCSYDVYAKFAMKTLENSVTSTLKELSKNEKGFFVMYEEAHIDKHCHNNDINKTFMSVVRFNQAIGLFMEFAFYNPETFLLITADHETGGLLPNGRGGYSYSSNDHTAHYVPVFAYGEGGELFDGEIVENIQIPKTIASFWSYEIKGDDNGKFPSLKKTAE